jgi:DNA-binding MarR family transcriptional regulator
VNKRCENPEDDRFVLWPMLLETHALLIDLLEGELDEIGGLPLTWYDVLVQLEMSSEGRLTMKELSRSVLLSKSGITRLVDRMERAGMIARDACPSDRRVVYAKVTDEGRALFKKASPVHHRGIVEHFTSYVTKEEAAAMKSALGKVLEAANEASREPGSRREAG